MLFRSGGLFTDFMNLSEEVVKNFLFTVVFVDDQAKFEDKEEIIKLKRPGRVGALIDKEAKGSTEGRIQIGRASCRERV